MHFTIFCHDLQYKKSPQGEVSLQSEIGALVYVFLTNLLQLHVHIFITCRTAPTVSFVLKTANKFFYMQFDLLWNCRCWFTRKDTKCWSTLAGQAASLENMDRWCFGSGASVKLTLVINESNKEHMRRQLSAENVELNHTSSITQIHLKGKVDNSWWSEMKNGVRYQCRHIREIYPFLCYELCILFL